MKRSVFTLICLCLGVLATTDMQAQNMLQKPKVYTQPTEHVNVDLIEKEVVSGKLWFVYGDRQGLAGTAKPGSGAKKKPIDFAEVYCAVEQNGPFIHIYKDAKVNYRGVLSSSAEDYGWFKRSDLLLWEHSMVTSDDQGKLPRKAMILNTLNSLKSANFDKLESGRVNFFLDPEMKKPSGRTSGLFQIYFVYKIDKVNKSVLIGKEYLFSRGGQKSALVGWVPQSRVVMWDQRVALEPNWESEAATERKGKNQPARFFLDKNSASNYRASGDANLAMQIWSDDSYDKRREGEYRRFPILQGKVSDGIAKVGVMGEINGEHAKMSAELMGKTQKTFTQTKAQARNVDIVFVIDATASMDPYYPPIIKGLKNAVQDIVNTPGDKNAYRFGSVVYRDAAEGNYAVETQKLTSKSTQVTTFLESIITNYKSRNANDKDAPEAVYYGLQSALRGVGLTEDHTNVMILIGDAGNHYRNDKTYVKAESLIKLLNQYSCNMLVFQAQNRSSATYQDFVSQTKYMVRKVAEDKYRELSQTASVADVQLKFPVWKEDKNAKIWRLQHGSLSGAVMVSPDNSSLAVEKLQGEIQKLISDIRDQHNRVLDAAEEITMSGEDLDTMLEANPDSESPYVSSFSAALLLFLEKNQFSKEQLDIISNKSYQMFMPGYAAIKLDGHKHPTLKSVLFLNRKELASLIRDIDRLAEVPTTSEMRQRLQDVWYELLRAHIGDIDREQIQEWSMERVSEVVFGIPTTSGLAAKPLKDLIDPAKVDDYLLNEFVRGVLEKSKELNRIFNSNNYKYSFISNDRSYYWIEQDLLP